MLGENIAMIVTLSHQKQETNEWTVGLNEKKAKTKKILRRNGKKLTQKKDKKKKQTQKSKSRPNMKNH